MPDTPEETRFYIACGKTIRNWAQFEITLAFYLQALLRTEQFRARAVFLRLPTYQSRKEMIRMLSATYVDDESYKKLEGFLERATRLNFNRNLVAHHLGGYAAENGEVWFLSDSIDRDLGVNFMGERKFQLSNIEGWPKAISTLQTEMFNWFAEFEAKVQERAKMHREKPDQE